jgi:YggT family protein
MGRIGPFRWSGCWYSSLACSAAPERLGSPRFIRPPPAMRSILNIILIVLDIYIWLLIAAAVLSWLVAFNVVNSRNQFVAMIGDFLYRITEPVLRPIRNVLPTLGGIDLSPVVLILVIILIKDIIVRYIYPVVP